MRNLFVIAGLCFTLLGTTGTGTRACRAQETARANLGPPLSAPQKQETERPSFGQLLGGSALGVPVGVGTGLLLLKASAEADPDGDRYDRGETPESEAAAAIGAIGLVALVAGGPIGAVEMGGIEHRRRDAYVAAGFGELVAGALGLVLAGQLHDSRTARLIGGGTGMTLGSAGGAYLVASQEKQDGLFGYRDGEWHLAPPGVRVRPNVGTDRSPSVGIALVSVEL